MFRASIRPATARPWQSWAPAAALAAAVLLWAANGAGLAQLAITEFVASNLTGLRDEDGETEDWIELANAGPATASLEGWYLTDSAVLLAKWRFPATNLAGGSRLVVFASGKNRTISGANLHTNFRLNADGGYLALLRPDGTTVESSFLYPRQFADVSYGRGTGRSGGPEVILDPGAPIKLLVPLAPIPDAWRGGDSFDDSVWTNGFFPAGYDVSSGAVYVAYVSPAAAGNQAFGGSLGMDFDVDQPVQVTALGCFDDLANGIAAGTTITVELWVRDTHGTPENPYDDTGMTVLATTNFTSTAPGSLTGANRFKTLPQPVVLTNGSYTIVARGYNANERNGNAGGDFPALTLNSGGGVLRFVKSRWSDAPVFPTVVDAQVAQYAGGTIRYQLVPQGNYRTSLLAMRNTNASVLVRSHFQPTPGGPWAVLSLDTSYDDGLVAWLNGVEIARRAAPAVLNYNSQATGENSRQETIDVSGALGALRAGENLLAIQGLNISSNDVDFRISVDLTGERVVTNNFYFLSPTPGLSNSAGVLFPGVVINEIYCNPPQSKTVPAEFIELYNPLPAPVDISGWAFTKGVSFTFPPGTAVPPDGYLLVAENPAVIGEVFGVEALGPWTGSLANDGETLELTDANGRTADRVQYGMGFPWPTVGDEPGFSMQLMNAGSDHELGGSWRSAAPTPGAPNAVQSQHVPPQIRQVAHQPQQPAADMPVTITAKITDPDGVQEVILEYQVVEPGNYIRLEDTAFPSNWTAIPMRDDGTIGDSTAGDSIYTAQIPASIQKHRRLIRYRISATDNLGEFVRVPYADDPCPNFAYFVYNGEPAWSGAVQPGVTPVSTFDTNVTRSVRPLQLLSRTQDVNDCQYNPAYDDSVYHFEGALVLDGIVYDHIHFRIAGQNSTYLTGKNKWKFQFNLGHRLAFTDDYGRNPGAGRESIKVSALTEPWAPWNRGLAGLDEAVANRLYCLSGLPAPRTCYYQLRVIDDATEADALNQYAGDLWGLYLGFEEYDEQFKEMHAMPDGNIFLLQAGNNRLAAHGSGQPDDLSDLNSFMSTSTGYNASPTQPLSWWRTNVNLPAYYTWRAVTEAINDTDIRDGENVAYFRNPTNGLWSIHPWDSDLLYEQFDRWGPNGVQSQTPYEQIRRCLQWPVLITEFQNRARELQDLLLNGAEAGKLVDEFAGLVTAHRTADPGFVEVDRRMWDWNPLTATVGGYPQRGNFYRTPFQPNFSVPARVLVPPDFAGMVQWAKDFIATDAHGGGRLAQMAFDPLIPRTPAIEYAGLADYPVDGLQFGTTAFSSPTNRQFAALEWRVGEIYDPAVPHYQTGEPFRYEVEPVWSSGELAAFEPQMVVPPPATRPGRTYRARVRMKDNAGYWSHWSAPLQFTATSGAAALRENLVISEIMYDPPAFSGMDGDAFEFLELKNIGTNSLDLTGALFTSGITFTFTNGTTLAPGAVFLLVRDVAWFALKYPGVAPNGVYTGKLDNAGETLALSTAWGQPIFSFRYENSAPWPPAAHGLGYSLVPLHPDIPFDPQDPACWRQSTVLGGSPGQDEPLLPPEISIGQDFTITLKGIPGMHYRLDYREVMVDARPWTVLVDLPSLSSPVYAFRATVPDTNALRFYRAVLVP